MAKCDLSPLDFAQKCPQNAGNTISENKFENVSGGGSPRIPLQMCCHCGLTFLERQI